MQPTATLGQRLCHFNYHGRMDGPEVQITLLLQQAGESDANAAEKLLPLVYDQLRRAAEIHFRAEDKGQTLQPTALVHEAYHLDIFPLDG